MTVSSQAGSGLRPAMSSGSVMLSTAASTGSRLNAWNTKPTRSRRSRVSRRSGIPLICSAPIHTLPLVAESRPAVQCISVDLPEPDGPITEVKDPAGIYLTRDVAAARRGGGHARADQDVDGAGPRAARPAS